MAEASRRLSVYQTAKPFRQVLAGRLVLEKIEVPRDTEILVPEAYQWANTRVFWVCLDGEAAGDLFQCVPEPGYGCTPLSIGTWESVGEVAFVGAQGGTLIAHPVGDSSDWEPIDLNRVISGRVLQSGELVAFRGNVFVEFCPVERAGSLLLTSRLKELEMVGTVISSGVIQYETGDKVIVSEGAKIRRVTRGSREVWAFPAEAVFCKVDELEEQHRR